MCIRDRVSIENTSNCVTQFLCKPKICDHSAAPLHETLRFYCRESSKPLSKGRRYLHKSNRKEKDKRNGTMIMTDDPLYYTEQELDDLFKERAAFAERIKAIGKDVQGLIASRHKLIAKICLLYTS